MALIIKVLAALLLIVLLLRKKIQLGYVMIIDALVLGLLFKLKLVDIMSTMAKTVTSWETIEFILILTVIMVLEHVMRKKLYIDKLLSSLKALVGNNKVVVAMMPSLIGLLPSAGGAVFSAPMVGELSKDMDIPPDQKGFINFWYRHIWEYVLPLYPSFLIAIQIMDISVADFVYVTFPLTLMTVIMGIPFGLKGIKVKEVDKEEKGRSHYIKELMMGIGPIFLIMILALVFRVKVLYAVTAVTILLLIINRYGFKEFIELLKESFSIRVVIMVAGIMIFKNMLGAANVINDLPSVLSGYGIPAVLAIFIICFSTGYLTGLISASVVVSFPIAMGIMSTMDLRMMAFALISCTAGAMVSPMHLCLTLTADYFKVDFGAIVKRVVVPQTSVVLFALALYYIF